MSKLPEEVRTAWDQRQDPIIFATADAQGVPNAIYATCVGLHGDDTLVVADNYFDKTRRNLEAGCKGSILFMTKDNKAFQVKGKVEYLRSGPVFDEMKQWNPPKHPGHAAAALRVEEVYSGARKLL